MKKILLPALLAASLAANAYLMLRPRAALIGSSAAQPPLPAHAPPSGPSAGGASPSDARTAATDERTAALLARWTPDYSTKSLRRLADQLRAAGLPPHAVRAAIEALVSRHTRAESEFAKLPFWQQGYGGQRFSAEADKMNASRRALLDAVLGPEDTDVASLDPIHRNVHYGQLPDEKIAALRKLQRDYAEIARDQNKNPDGTNSHETPEGRRRLRLIEEERARDAAAILTPAEYREWELRSTLPSLTVIRGAKDIDVTPEEFAALFDIQKQYQGSLANESGAAESLAYFRGWAAPAEQIRTVLGDDRFYTYLEKTDPSYAVAAKFAQSSSLNRAQTYALYQLQLEALAAVSRTGAPGRTGDLANTPEGRAALAPFNARLETLLGRERAAEYRRAAAGKLFAGPR